MCHCAGGIRAGRAGQCQVGDLIWQVTFRNSKMGIHEEHVDIFALLSQVTILWFCDCHYAVG